METLEAESVVETFLSTAVMGHLETVTIIHGKGHRRTAECGA